MPMLIFFLIVIVQNLFGFSLHKLELLVESLFPEVFLK